MSLSTTSTASYVLTKYSRSYPQTNLASQQSQSKQASDEWQHYTNPVMRLVLDIKKRATGELDSYRLRIVWSLNSGPDTMDVDQRDVVFEDIDLLSFSNIPNYDPHMQAAALPLKAVYRDTIVGIRYLHPRIVPAGATPMYRRIQVNFETTSDATNFIEAVRQVCPCKTNPVGAPARSTTMKPPNRAMAPTDVSSTQPSWGARSDEVIRPVQPTRPASPLRPSGTMSKRTHTPKYGQHIFNPIGSLPSALPSVPPPSSQPRPQSILHSSSGTTASTTLNQVRPPANANPPPVSEPTQFIIQTPSSSTTYSSDVPSSDLALPSSSLPTSSASSSSVAAAAPPPPLPSVSDPILALTSISSSTSTMSSNREPVTRVATNKDSDAHASTHTLLNALRETPALYDLPRAELEYLIAQVIREDGFVKLLETLDSMWMLKGLFEIK